MNSEQDAVGKKIAILAPKRKKHKQPKHGDGDGDNREAPPSGDDTPNREAPPNDTPNGDDKPKPEQKEEPKPSIDQASIEEEAATFVKQYVDPSHKSYNSMVEAYKGLSAGDVTKMDAFLQRPGVRQNMHNKNTYIFRYIQALNNHFSAPRNDAKAPEQKEDVKSAADKPPALLKRFSEPKADETLSDKPKTYTDEDYKNKLRELKEENNNKFQGNAGYLRQATFIKLFKLIRSDNTKFQEVMKMLDKPLTKNTISAAAEYLMANTPKFKEKLAIARNMLYDIKEHDLKGIKRGDKLPPVAFKKIEKALRIFNSPELTTGKGTKGAKVQQLVHDVFGSLGMKMYLQSKGGVRYIKYDEDVKEQVKHDNGKLDIVDNPEFFTYDMHDIINIIQRELKIKLSDAAKTNIEAIMERETRDMRYKSSTNHGYSDINGVISKIERYINKRKKIDGHIFKFSEAGRFALKEILKSATKKEVESHGVNGQELMFRLQNLIL